MRVLRLPTYLKPYPHQTHQESGTTLHASTTKTPAMSKKMAKLLEESISAPITDRAKLKLVRKAIKNAQKSLPSERQDNSSIAREHFQTEEERLKLVTKIKRYVNKALNTPNHERRSRECKELVEAYLTVLKAINPDKSAQYTVQLAQLFREMGKSQDAMRAISQELETQRRVKPKKLKDLLFQKALIQLEHGHLNKAAITFELAKQHGFSLKKSDFAKEHALRSLEAASLRVRAPTRKAQF